MLLFGSIVAFRFIPDIPIYWYENTILAINVAGCLIPVVISARMVKSGRASFMDCLIGVAVVAVIAYHLSEFIAGKGVLISNIYLPSLVAAMIGIGLCRSSKMHQMEHLVELQSRRDCNICESCNPEGISTSKKIWDMKSVPRPLSSSMGILVGADMLRLNEILAYQPPTLTLLSIGGAGIFDAIFVAGIIAVTLGILIMPLARMIEGPR